MSDGGADSARSAARPAATEATEATGATGAGRAPLYARGVAYVMVAGCFWSLAGILIRNIEAADEWQILFVRSAAVFVSLLLVLLFRYRGNLVRPFAQAGLAGLIGGACLGIAFAAYIFALTGTTVANAVFILSAGPILTAVLAWVLLGERVRRATWIATVVAMIGIAVMVIDGVNAGALFGNVMALCAVTGFAAFAVALRWGGDTDMLPAACVAGLVGAAFGLLMVADLDLSLRDVVLASTMGVVQIAIGMLFFTAGARHVPAAELALLSLTEVVLAPIWVWIGVGEVPRLLTLVGGGIVLAAIVGRAVTGLRRKPAPFGSV